MTKSAHSLTGYKRFFIIMGVLSLAAIALNLTVRRGPVQDANAVEDIRSMAGSIDGYYTSQTRLPSDLADIKTSLSAPTWQRIHNYDYTPLSSAKYRICTTFVTASSSNNGITVMPYPASANPDPGTHGKGRQCFEYTANVFNSGGPKGL